MYYWNYENFSGLKEIGEKYVGVSNFELFASYCIQKEKGLKKDALKSIEKFVLLVKEKTITEQREIAQELAFLSYCNPNIHQLISHPLQVLLLNIFKNWTEEEINNVAPYRWLGYLSKDARVYEKAIEIDPFDEISLYELACLYIKDLDYQTHHLSESFFIGDINNAKQSLAILNNLIKRLKQGDLLDMVMENMQYFTRLIDAWEDYKNEERSLPFPEWCDLKGEKFGFWNIIYYNK